jgi:hypothetical protein
MPYVLSAANKPIMLSIFMLSDVVLNVVAPLKRPEAVFLVMCDPSMNEP